jgi:hypothetical protein
MAFTKRYLAAIAVLEAEGLVRQAAGFDTAELYAFAEQRGWTVTTERLPSSSLTVRWRAALFAPTTDPRATWVTTGGTFAQARTEEEALAVAIASMLQRITTYPNLLKEAAKKKTPPTS